MLCPGLDGGDEVVDRAEDTTGKPAFSEKREPPFNEVQPRQRGWHEVRMPPGAFSMREPRSDPLGLVGEQVVEQDMDLEVAWQVEVDQLEGGAHVGGLVRAPRVVEDLAGGDVHRREQVSGAVALVVAGHAPCPTRLHGQGRLGAIEACTWVFSSKLKTIAPSGGWR